MARATRQGTDALDAMPADENARSLDALHRLAAQLLALMLQPKENWHCPKSGRRG